MFREFLQEVERGNIRRSRLSSLRIKTHVGCQWACVFCHMEGNHASGTLGVGGSLEDALRRFRDEGKCTEVHLSGGEPSIHSQIVECIRMAHALGYRVKMTTNGIAHQDRYRACIDAGLSEVNVSVHTLNGKALGNIMCPPRSESWGNRMIARQQALMHVIKGDVRLKINTVVADDEIEALKIAEVARELDASWRPMNVLEMLDESYDALRRLCCALGAHISHAVIIDGSSSCSLAMQTDNSFAFKVKLIRPHRIPAMCDGCAVDAKGQCFEYVYGPRLEAQDGNLFVRSCLHRHGAPYVLPPTEYFLHPLARSS